jgi:hypothetical protein
VLQLAAGTDALLTTEKDRLNMPADLPVPVYCLEVEFDLDATVLERLVGHVVTRAR